MEGCCYLQSGWQEGIGAAALKERRGGGGGDSPLMPARDQGDSSFGTFPGRLGKGGGLLPSWFPRRLHSASVFFPWTGGRRKRASERWFAMGHIVYGV